ncbi:hypothetical protein Tco_1211207 [Tanacetum coccineum]
MAGGSGVVSVKGQLNSSYRLGLDDNGSSIWSIRELKPFVRFGRLWVSVRDKHRVFVPRFQLPTLEVTGISLVEIGCGCLRDVFLDVISVIVAIEVELYPISFNSATGEILGWSLESARTQLSTMALFFYFGSDELFWDLLSLLLELSARPVVRYVTTRGGVQRVWILQFKALLKMYPSGEAPENPWLWTCLGKDL